MSSLGPSELQTIAQICRARGVIGVYLFGSAARARSVPHDIDLILDLGPNSPLDLFTLGELQMDLSDRLGKPVHLTLLGGIPTADRPAILADSRLLDAA